jgi:hypothetical protein
MIGKRGYIGILTILLVGAAAWPAAAHRAPGPDFRSGALYGKVVDAASGKPVENATVAIEDKHGKVVAWTKTDAAGQYAVAADALKLLQIHPTRHRGLLGGLVHGMVEVVTVPVKVAEVAVDTGMKVVKEVNPIPTAEAAAVSAMTANPAPVASRVADTALNALKGKAQRSVQENAVKTVVGQGKPPSKKRRPLLLPGELLIAVGAPGYQEIKDVAGAYWLQPPATVDRKPVGSQAWLDTVKLAPDGSSKKSEIEKMAVQLTEAQIDPPLAPAGTPVKLSVRLLTPGGVPLNVRVFAREQRNHQVVELKPQGNNLFAGELRLDPKTPPGDTTVTIAALRAEPVAVPLDRNKPDALLHLAEQLDELDASRPYDYDPRILASENRLDVKLTVLNPGQGTPPSAVPPPTPLPAAVLPAKPSAQPVQPAARAPSTTSP